MDDKKLIGIRKDEIAAMSRERLEMYCLILIRECLEAKYVYRLFDGRDGTDNVIRRAEAAQKLLKESKDQPRRQP